MRKSRISHNFLKNKSQYFEICLPFYMFVRQQIKIWYKNDNLSSTACYAAMVQVMPPAFPDYGVMCCLEAAQDIKSEIRISKTFISTKLYFESTRIQQCIWVDFFHILRYLD
jgi:hypothetical protein